MNSVRIEVRDLIALNEKIQRALLQGERLTDSEKQIIRLCSTDLNDLDYQVTTSGVISCGSGSSVHDLLARRGHHPLVPNVQAY
jgi:hypothetical protein